MPDHKDKKNNKVTGRRERVSTMLSRIDDKFTNQTEKATLGDYVRLTQLETELEDEEDPKEVRVRWVDSTETLSTES